MNAKGKLASLDEHRHGLDEASLSLRSYRISDEAEESERNQLHRFLKGIVIQDISLTFKINQNLLGQCIDNPE